MKVKQQAKPLTARKNRYYRKTSRRNIFIGNVVWGGDTKLKETLDQLLGYTTCAIIN
jgi:hypothetical protein